MHKNSEQIHGLLHTPRRATHRKHQGPGQVERPDQQNARLDIDQWEVWSGVSHALAAASIVSMPVRSVGSITGAKFGAWLTGSSSSLPAFSVAAYWSGSMPP